MNQHKSSRVNNDMIHQQTTMNAMEIVYSNLPSGHEINPSHHQMIVPLSEHSLSVVTSSSSQHPLNQCSPWAMTMHPSTLGHHHLSTASTYQSSYFTQYPQQSPITNLSSNQNGFYSNLPHQISSSTNTQQSLPVLYNKLSENNILQAKLNQSPSSLMIDSNHQINFNFNSSSEQYSSINLSNHNNYQKKKPVKHDSLNIDFDPLNYSSQYQNSHFDETIKEEVQIKCSDNILNNHSQYLVSNNDIIKTDDSSITDINIACFNSNNKNNNESQSTNLINEKTSECINDMYFIGNNLKQDLNPIELNTNLIKSINTQLIESMPDDTIVKNNQSIFKYRKNINDNEPDLISQSNNTNLQGKTKNKKLQLDDFANSNDIITKPKELSCISNSIPSQTLSSYVSLPKKKNIKTNFYDEKTNLSLENKKLVFNNQDRSKTFLNVSGKNSNNYKSQPGDEEEQRALFASNFLDTILDEPIMESNNSNESVKMNNGNLSKYIDEPIQIMKQDKTKEKYCIRFKNTNTTKWIDRNLLLKNKYGADVLNNAENVFFGKTKTREKRKQKKQQSSGNSIRLASNCHQTSEIFYKKLRNKSKKITKNQDYEIIDYIQEDNQIFYKIVRRNRKGIIKMSSQFARDQCPLNIIHFLESKFHLYKSLPFESIVKYSEQLKKELKYL